MSASKTSKTSKSSKSGGGALRTVKIPGFPEKACLKEDLEAGAVSEENDSEPGADAFLPFLRVRQAVLFQKFFETSIPQNLGSPI